MHPADWIALVLYFAFVVAVGAGFFRKNERVEEYFVGDRRMGAGHLGLSIVATDVGGGFSIGLGGLGFTMGISGSWLLFTGLVGAWMAAVLLVPHVKRLGDRHRWLTFPQLLGHRFGPRVRLAAALVSGIGYAGFVGAQILAGAKLSSVAFGIGLVTAVVAMAVVVVAYTALGGIKAVIYTDTIQWLILLGGLLFLALPFGWASVGGWEAIRAALPPDHFRLDAVGADTLVAWAVTIIPIWFVGMTIYQRIYAARDERTARRAFYFAGLLEWPLMALAGTALGMIARVAYPETEPELGLPTLVRNVLPAGIAGTVIAAYFAAIMSTADSCLLASVGNFVNDVYQTRIHPQASERRVLAWSRVLTVVIGFGSVSIALALPRVLDAILLAYGFMVSGLLVPTLAALYWPRASAEAAMASMLVGGGLAVLFGAFPSLSPVSEPILVSLPASAATLVLVSLRRRPAAPPAPDSALPPAG